MDAAVRVWEDVSSYDPGVLHADTGAEYGWEDWAGAPMVNRGIYPALRT